MEYIDKNIHLQEGNSYSSDYLYDSFNNENRCFIPPIASTSTYEDFRKKKYRYGEGAGGRRGFEPLLIEEQEKRCCYCMGRIKSGAVTFEHIIPQNFKENQVHQEEFDYYASHAPILSEHVILASMFNEQQFTCKEDTREVDKYPHLISYVNLAASCKGIIDMRKPTSCFCNSPRGNDRIIPLMLINNCRSRVNYNELGQIVITGFDAIEIANTITALNLNHPTLQQIRILWYKISRTATTISEVLSMVGFRAKAELLKTLFNIDDYTKLDSTWKSYAPIPLRGQDECESIYWNLFKKYDWF